MTGFFRILPLFALVTILFACGEKPREMAAEQPAPKEMEAKDFGGLALYTLRDTLAGDPQAILQEVADMGYAYVEAAGYDQGKFYGMEPATFKAMLESVGLTPVSSHYSGITIENAEETVKAHNEVGFKYIVIPIPPMGAFYYDDATQSMGMNQSNETVMANVNAIAAVVSAGGLECLYHNHDFEFRADKNGIVPIEYFLENSDPSVLNFQMDLYWVTKAGADPLDYFNRYSGRFKAWHVKDMDDEGRFAPVGEGNIDFKRILAAREKSGMEFYFVEQDICFNHTAMKAIAISHKGLKEIGFK